MSWDIAFSRQVEKFLARRRLDESVLVELVAQAIKKFDGDTVTIDLKRLSGSWEGHFRIRTGKYRVIFSIDFDTHKVLVEVFDSRDRVYR